MERFTITTPGAELTFIPRKQRNYGTREYFTAPRMYVDLADENLLENLANRRRRPYNVYKKMIRRLDLAGVLDISKLSWSQHAGCSMCPCSPGFILERQSVSFQGQSTRYFDVWVTLDDAPTVDERKAPRVIVDPTLVLS